jgi:tripartite-type tricarboxylate transporter receptor subunit TctC
MLPVSRIPGSAVVNFGASRDTSIMTHAHLLRTVAGIEVAKAARQPKRMRAMTTAVSRREILLATASICLLLAGPSAAIGQDQYPDRLIKIIVPDIASTTDTLARIVADKLQSKWGKPVIVENRPGASTNIGAEAVAKAEPEANARYSPVTFSVSQHLFSNLRHDPAAFVPITVIATTPNVLVVRPGLPASSVQELIALAKSQPGKLTFGSPGRGTLLHLAAEMLKAHAGIDMVHVPYKGSGFLNDMLGGRIDLAFATLTSASQHLESGQLRALAVGSATRSALLSNVPALAETIPGFASTAWFAVAAPPKTSPQIAEKLSSAIRAALREPDALAKLQNLKFTPILNSPSEAAAFFREESERWRKVIVSAGIKAY